MKPEQKEDGWIPKEWEALDAATKRRVMEKIAKQRAGLEKIGRNDPCPCGSGKKFKRCHLSKFPGRRAGPR